MDLLEVYNGQDVGKSLLIKQGTPFFAAAADNIDPLGFLAVNSKLVIAGYVNGDPKNTVAPLWLIVNNPEGISYLIKKDDTGFYYDYTNAKDYTLLAGTALLAAGYAFKGAGTGRIGAVEQKKTFDATKLIVPGVIVIGSYFILKPILQGLGILNSDEQNAKEAAIKKQLGENAGSEPSTKTDAEWAIIADTIHEDLGYSGVSNNEDDAAYQLARVQNDTDVLKLITYYGSRWITFFGIPRGKFTLSETVHAQLSQDKINAVNDNYSRKGIKFTW